jgi:hypothetical protein
LYFVIDDFSHPTPEGQKPTPTVTCRRFLHFRNLKHRNLSRLILASSHHNTSSGFSASRGSLETSPRLDFGGQPELCQQAAGVMIRMAVQSAWFRGDMQGM